MAANGVTHGSSALYIARESNEAAVETAGPGASDRDDSEPRLHVVRTGLARLISERRAEIAAAQGAPAAQETDV